jgi:hypothetical protein
VERLAYCLDAGEQKWRTNEHVFINVCSLCTREHFGSIANFVRFVRFFGGNGHVKHLFRLVPMPNGSRQSPTRTDRLGYPATGGRPSDHP